jgi:hypothetical protein
VVQAVQLVRACFHIRLKMRISALFVCECSAHMRNITCMRQASACARFHDVTNMRMRTPAGISKRTMAGLGLGLGLSFRSRSFQKCTALHLT